MSEPVSALYAKLLGETARISWTELQPFFARGALLWVATQEDLVGVAEALASDDKARVAAWLAAGTIAPIDPVRAEDWLSRDPELWAVVVSPWVVVQERSGQVPQT